MKVPFALKAIFERFANRRFLPNDQDVAIKRLIGFQLDLAFYNSTLLRRFADLLVPAASHAKEPFMYLEIDEENPTKGYFVLYHKEDKSEDRVPFEVRVEKVGPFRNVFMTLMNGDKEYLINERSLRGKVINALERYDRAMQDKDPSFPDNSL